MQNHDMMVASDLQRALVKDLEEVLADVVTVDAQGRKVSGIKGYAQVLPNLVGGDGGEDEYFPYFIVRVQNGKVEDDDSPWTVKVMVIIGIHDPGEDAQGHFSLMVAIDRITTRFSQEATLGKRGHMAFRCLPTMQWALQDEDTYPYYFGAVSLEFLVPKAGRSDPIEDW